MVGPEKNHRDPNQFGDEYEGVDLVECGMHAYPEFVSNSMVAGGQPPSDARVAGRKSPLGKPVDLTA